jgi:APA family basic amino acid/polyamine antiporter
MSAGQKDGRSIGLLGATSIGVGAIVGGGILALAGVALATTGPSAILAFALNGLLALLTALSFAELSSGFPESGGTYTFAKKVLSVEVAFAVGWVVWFASIAAGVLYSLGFAYFTAIALKSCLQLLPGPTPAWLTEEKTVALLALAAIAVYALGLARRMGGGASHWENLGKLVLFAILILGGFWVVAGRPAEALRESLTPFFSAGGLGLFQAMGFTFIALQGFDLIAAGAGEVRDPARTIPRAMFLSLGIALGVYLPLLLVIAVAGVGPGESITMLSKENPEAIVAVAARQFLGPFGYWLVIVAGILSMLSALRANLFAASRVVLAMARDRTMPYGVAAIHGRWGTPVAAILTTAIVTGAIVLAVRDVAAAGAASSLIFLITFALAHWITIRARRRGGRRAGAFRTPWFPLVPAAGMTACLILAAYQGFAVPSAGLVAGIWLCVGGILFLGLFARPARVVDASTEAQDPEVSRLRGRTPLILVPITNPHNAEPLVAVAHALAPPEVGRVLLLSVAVLPKGWKPGDKALTIRHAQSVLGDTLNASIKAGRFPEALATVAADPWVEISRVAREHRCESLLLGFTQLKGNVIQTPLDALLPKVACDVVVLRAPPGWRLADVERILVPIGGRRWHDRLRARLLGSLFRTGQRQVTFLQVIPKAAAPARRTRARRELSRVARDGRRRKTFGPMTLRIARETSSPILIISHRG